MPTAYLLHGYIGAGKTTFARELKRTKKAVRFSHDEWMVRLYGSNPPHEKFHEYWLRVEEIFVQLWPRLLSLGVDVIIDEGLWHRFRRDDLRKIIASVGATAKLYHITCSEAVMKERVKKRNENLTDSFLIDENGFEDMKKRVEPLGDDEEFELVSTG